jgi:hypothetical protein
MSILQRIRLICAIVLVIGLFLPLSECSRHEHATSPAKPKTFLQHAFPQDNDDFVYDYAFTKIKPSSWQAGGLGLVALLWPIVFFFITRKRAERRRVWIFYLIEVLLAAGTLYWLHLFTALGDWLYGAYVVCFATVVYGLTSLWLLVQRIRNRTGARTQRL